MNIKRMIASIIEIAIGICLTVCGMTGIVDEYWSGMGTALIVVGALQLLRNIRDKVDTSYRENVDVQAKDERNQYLGIKAWSWAGFYFMMIAAVASVVLKIAGFDDYSVMAGGSVCLLVLLYWLSYLYLRKKY